MAALLAAWRAEMSVAYLVGQWAVSLDAEMAVRSGDYSV